MKKAKAPRSFSPNTIRSRGDSPVNQCFSSFEHPAVRLLAVHSSEIERSRTDVLRELRRTSKPLARLVADLFKSRHALNPPAIGEVWPWLIGDLAGLPCIQVRRVAKAWLALYTYALMLDATCDEAEAAPNALQALAGALLFEMGFGDFFAMTAGTPWNDVVRDAFRAAIHHQEADVRYASDPFDLRAKKKSAAGKNSGFVICTAALAATTKVDGLMLEGFARSLMLALQHLDDIADFEEDWRSKNFTPILTRARKSLRKVDRLSGGRSEILEALIVSGALRDVLLETFNGITRALNLLNHDRGETGPSAAAEFFETLRTSILAGITAVNAAAIVMRSSSPMPVRKQAIIRVEKALVVVGQQS